VSYLLATLDGLELLAAYGLLVVLALSAMLLARDVAVAISSMGGKP